MNSEELKQIADKVKKIKKDDEKKAAELIKKRQRLEHEWDLKKELEWLI